MALSALTCRCGRPVDGRTLCAKCEHTLDVAIGNIPAYYADLELAATRQKGIRYDQPRGKGGSKSLPLAVDSRFLPDGKGHTARQAARNTITTWVRVCLEEWPNADDGPKRDTIASCCAYLHRMLPRIAVAAWADEMLRELLTTERELLRVDARPPEKIYAGLCMICLVAFEKTPLYAMPGDEFVTCPASDCGMTYRVEDRRNLMLDALEYEWLTAARIADQAVYLQRVEHREWARKKLNRWHADGFLRAASVNERGEPLFPFGDACRLLVAAESNRRSDTRKRA